MKRKTRIAIAKLVVARILLVILTFFVGIQFFKVFNKEVVNVEKFTDYYEDSDAANGGFEILDSNFITISQKYTLKNDKKNEEKKVIGNKEVVAKDAVPTFEIYTVKSGDTIYEISKKFNQGISIIKANNPHIGPRSLIKPGDKLTITSKNGVFYKVRKGDSLYLIAKNYKVKIEDIIKYNKLQNNILKPGQKLFLLNPVLTSFKPATQKSTAKTVAKKVNFKMPVKWRGVTSSYGSRFHPVLKRYILHKGVDLAAKYTSLYAAKDGKVTYTGWMSGYGKIIIIRHSGGYETRSAHLNNIYVKTGQYVKQGDLIGKTGMTGRVTGPHLHFEIRKNGKAYNPMQYLVK